MQTHTAQTNKNKHFTLPSFLIPLHNNKDVDNSKTRGEKREERTINVSLRSYNQYVKICEVKLQLTAQTKFRKSEVLAHFILLSPAIMYLATNIKWT